MNRKSKFDIFVDYTNFQVLHKTLFFLIGAFILFIAIGGIHQTFMILNCKHLRYEKTGVMICTPSDNAATVRCEPEKIAVCED